VRCVPYRTLLVDDAADLRLLVRRLLERDGRFEIVGESPDGADGVDRARELQPQLVVLDLSMPVMDGLQALPLIIAACPDTRVLVLSGVGGAQMSRTALDLGASAYVEKGAAFGELAERLASLVTGRPDVG
jgi:two-component system chemotaxis response regulator CheY